jgi:hypothetical protein
MPNNFNIFYGDIDSEEKANAFIKIFFWISCIHPISYLLTSIVNSSTANMAAWKSFLMMIVAVSVIGFYFIFKKTKKLLYAYACSVTYIVFIVSNSFLKLPKELKTSSIILSYILLAFMLWMAKRFLEAARLVSGPVLKV